MIYSLRGLDPIAYLGGVSADDIRDSLTLDDVETFLQSLGVTRIEKYASHIICPTICHNAIDDDTASMKLYYYQKDKNFYCYTNDCGSMTIFQLYQKVMALNYHEVSYEEAQEYVKQCLKKIEFKKAEKKNSPLIIDKTKYSFERATIRLDAFNPSVLDCFLKIPHSLWLNEGISKEAMRKFNISYSLRDNKIIIPQFDIKGRLIGIRGRALNQEEVESGRKYMPIKVGDVLYNHQTGFTLYGIYEHQKAIKKYRRAILFESEKSVLKHDSFYGEESVALAICGSNVNKYQINLLTKILGVSEIVIALDKEETKKDWRGKNIKICKKYSPYAEMSYIFDEHHLLKDKDSPIDEGQEKWEELFRKRIKVR